MNNFERTYLQANEFERKAGFYWYLDNHHYIKDMADSLNTRLDIACGVVAALSPMIAWGDNLNLAYQMLKFKGKPPGKVKSNAFPRNIQKALKIIKTKKVFPYLR